MSKLSELIGAWQDGQLQSSGYFTGRTKDQQLEWAIMEQVIAQVQSALDADVAFILTLKQEGCTCHGCEECGLAADYLAGREGGLK